ncbi:MAG: ATP-binding protein [Candidatus Saccharibacteria bacterium]
MVQVSLSSSDDVSLSPKLVTPAALGVVILLLINFFTKQTYTTNRTLVLSIAAGLTLFAFSHFIPHLKFGKAHAFYLYSYHWILAGLLIFIVPVLSYYLYLWVLLICMAEFFYQAKGTILSGTALLATMLLGTLYQYNGITKDLLFKIIPEFTLILLVNLILTRLVFGNRQSRKVLSEKIVRAEYEHGRLLALINSMSDAVVAVNDEGKITTYNAAVLDLLDTNKTLSDTLIDDVLLLQDAKGESVLPFELAKNTKHIKKTSDYHIPLDGNDHVDLDISISRIGTSGLLAKQQGYIILLRDITKEKSLDEERDLFISEVSHELRTPITIAEGELSMAVMLAEKPETDAKAIKESVVRGHDQIVFLADMVNDLSALSRAQRDDIQIDVETFKIEDVMSEILTTYKPQAEKRGLWLKLEMAPTLPEIATSRLYFREILQNFVTNAIKYTDHGGVIIKCQAVDRDNVIIDVIDTGAGIAKTEQSKVYDKFWRSEDPYTRSTSGTGLGLFITAKLAHRIGGTLRLTSKLKEGSTFSLLLPVKAKRSKDKINFVKSELALLLDKNDS